MKDGRAALDRSKCTVCGKCAEACLADCSQICGIEAEDDALFEILKRDRLFFENSGGGVTVSGGEPLAQSGAVINLAKRAKDENISFAVETSGYGDREALFELNSLGCLFLYDIKGIDDEKHKINVGVSNGTILSNLEALADAGADLILRLPLIPGYNDTERDLELLSGFLSKYRGRVRRAEIMPYHRIGLGKLAALGREAKEVSDIPDGKAYSGRWRLLLSESGVNITIEK